MDPFVMYEGVQWVGGFHNFLRKILFSNYWWQSTENKFYWLHCMKK